ncbi:tyrosine--tRNA ligase, mitochondrial-like, partial [Lingula anatina]|uniref:Tyrosine--tRNA ligase n=1 Tax=Lingula anatina TaxID=7574 RepID=A0A1S3JBF6_LINAN
RAVCLNVWKTERQPRRWASRNILGLHERGVFHSIFPEKNAPELLKLLSSTPQCIYCGFDPTADSLHIGNLLPLIALLHCQRGGHDVIALIGGATSQIGDPSGRTRDRDAISLDNVEKNVASLHGIISNIFTNHERYIWRSTSRKLGNVSILNNNKWYGDENVIQFLSTIGKCFRIGKMLQKESVRQRLQSPEGMNLSEFTYQIFQAYDWLHLLSSHNCRIQLGGQDQMGNIDSGYELINRINGKQVFGLTVPLLTNNAGQKMGKSTGGEVLWLHPAKTSPFEFYQYFLRLPDADVEKFVKLFTFLPDDKIENLLRSHKLDAGLRSAQRFLAEQITILVHGEAGLELAKKCTKILYENSAETLAELTTEELLNLFSNAPTIELTLEAGSTVIDACMKAKCFTREVDAERIIKGGGVYINTRKVIEPDFVLIPGEHILPNHITVIRIGKKNHYIIKWR